MKRPAPVPMMTPGADPSGLAGVAPGRIALPAALTLLLAACSTTAPDMTRPVPMLPAQFPGTTAADAAAPAADWWRALGSAELDGLVQQALQANGDLAQAVARVELAEAQWREAGGAQSPSLTLGSSANRRQLGADTPANATTRALTANDFRVALSASYEIDFWGRLRGATDAARAQLLASRASRDTVRLSVAALVAQGWIALRALDEQIALSRQTLRTREEAVRVLGLRLAGGTASRLDVEQAELLRADGALALRELQRQRSLAQSQLGLLVGDSGLSVPEGTLPVALPAAPPPGLPSALLERRPDLKRAEDLLTAADAQMAVARTAMLPSVSLTGALGQESTELASLLRASTRFWDIGLSLVLPLLDGGRNQARVDQAGARRAEAAAAYRLAVANAFKDVADALAAASAARESAPLLVQRAAAAERALTLTKARFDAGYSGQLEHLDAQRQAVSARLDQVRNRQAQLSATVDLFRALGGGWTRAE